MQQNGASLKGDIRRFQFEYDIFKKDNELLMKGLGASPQLLSNREKTQLFESLKNTYALADLLCELDPARSSCFYRRARQRMPDKHAEVRIVLPEVFHGNHRCLGYRRLQAMVCRRQLSLSEKVIQRLVKQECLIATANKKTSVRVLSL